MGSLASFQRDMGVIFGQLHDHPRPKNSGTCSHLRAAEQRAGKLTGPFRDGLSLGLCPIEIHILIRISNKSSSGPDSNLGLDVDPET